MSRLIFIGSSILATLALGGCGSNSEGVTSVSTSANPLAASSTLSGRVVDAQGRGQAGVKLGFQERATGEVALAATGSDGSFSQQMPTGVYDVSLDKQSDPAFASCFYGPVTVQGAAQREFVLQSTGGHTSAEIFGQLLLQPGQPGANRRIVVDPVAADFLGDERPLQPMEVTTDAAGKFTVPLFPAESIGCNVYVYRENGTLDERFDLDLAGGVPTFAEVTTEEPGEVENLLGYGESLTGPEGDTKDPTLLPPREIRARDWSQFQKLETESPDSVGTNYQFLVNLTDGSFPVGSGHVLLIDSVARPDPSIKNYADILNFLQTGNQNNTAFPRLAVSTDVRDVRWFFYKQAAWIYSIEPGIFKIKDQTNDTYRLEVDNTNVWHSVAYNSDKPTVTEVKFFKYVDTPRLPTYDSKSY